MQRGMSKLELSAVVGLMVVSVAALVMSGGGLSFAPTVLAGSMAEVSSGGGNEPDNIVSPGGVSEKVMPAIGSPGQVSFYTGTITQTGDNNLYWDNTNKRLGVGTASPLRKLHYYGDAALFQRDVDAAGFIIQRTDTNRWVFGASENPSLGTGFSIYTYPVGAPSATPRLFLDLDGRVGIGTTSPSYKLHVVSSDTTTDARAVYGETTSSDTYGIYGKNTGSGNYGYLGGSNDGVLGQSTDGYGVEGGSTNGIGVHGSSYYGWGVRGSSVDSYGMYGYSNNSKGVYGVSTGSLNYGYLGDNSYGVYGRYGTDGPYGYMGGEHFGVYGENYSTAADTAGVHGYSPNITGVDGFSYYGTGVKGYSNNGTGVSGGSWEGNGVTGKSGNGYAGYFDGKVYASGNVGIGAETPHSKLQVAGPIATNYTYVNVGRIMVYHVTASDSIIAVEASEGYVHVRLPTAVGIQGRAYTIKKIDSSEDMPVFVYPDPSQTIDGEVGYILSSQWAYITVVSDGSSWLIIGQSTFGVTPD